MALQQIKNLLINGSALSVGTQTYSGDKTVTFSGEANTGRHQRMSSIKLTITQDTTKAKNVDIYQLGSAIHKKNSDVSITSDASDRIKYITGVSNATTIKVIPMEWSAGSWEKKSNVQTMQGVFVSGSTIYGTTYNSEIAPVAQLAGSWLTSSNRATLADEGTGYVLESDGYYSLTQAHDVGADQSYTFNIPIQLPVNNGEIDVIYRVRLEASGTDENGDDMTFSAVEVEITSSKSGVKLNIYSSSSDMTSEVQTYTLSVDGKTKKDGSSASFYVDSNTTWTIS